ncbi:hypothetical protein ZIOFF_027879 [Zingiber officinale]|uniref:BED-type domain-containing protein n=1 Tax=Zingiber officinale TaxID=94328 RepID=A0A8J5GNV0_ZINOF|nr:hypothetical protein ZIOFF_027879 [Zingiber officinale]
MLEFIHDHSRCSRSLAFFEGRAEAIDPCSRVCSSYRLEEFGSSVVRNIIHGVKFTLRQRQSKRQQEWDGGDKEGQRRTQQQFVAARRSPAASVASLLKPASPLCSSQRSRCCLQKPGDASSPAQQQPSQKPAAARRCSASPAAARNSSPVAALFLVKCLIIGSPVPRIASYFLVQLVVIFSLLAMESFQNESGSAHEDVDDYSPLWKFVTKVEKAVGGGNVTWSCNICNKVCKGSYSRVKAHLLKQKGAGIAGCTAVTMDQMKRMQQLIDDAELRKKNSKQKEVPLPSSSTSSNMASKSSFCTSGILQNDDPTKKRKGPLGALEKSFNLNARDELHSEIARLFYTGGLSFNIARNPHYVRAFSLATQRTIPGYLPPGYNLLRTSLLQKEKAHIGKLLEPTKAAWK